MKINHNFFSNLSFNLAENNLGKTNMNPSVGCVIVKNNSIISSGITSFNGRPHAEFNALNKKINFKDSVMYVTLEPCSHHGLTPPCIQIIRKKKIKKVYYCYNDPDKRTYKKAKKLLRNVKKLNHLKIFKKDFYRSYILNKKFQFPLIDAKLAMSKDFFTINRKSKWITNERSRKVGHLLRSKYDCIISTSDSINRDNSLLNCRISGLNNYKPDLIIIDRNFKLKKNLKLLNICKLRKTYIFTINAENNKSIFFKKRNIKIIKIRSLSNIKDFKILFDKIFKIGKGRILVETGLSFLNELLKFKLINDLYIFKSKKNLKKNGYNNCDNNYIKRLKFNRAINVNLNDDKLFKIRIK